MNDRQTSATYPFQRTDAEWRAMLTAEQYAVMQYRLAFQQAAVALAGRVESIRHVHLADRTAFPWTMKDAGRATMAQLIATSVIGQSPFKVTQTDVQYRKLSTPVSVSRHATPGGIVPVLGEATLVRSNERARD